MFWAEVTDDNRYLVVSIVEGTENKSRLWVYPIMSGERSKLGAPIKIIDEAVAEFVLAGSDGATLYLRTDLEAEAGRLVAVDLDSFDDSEQVRWREVVPESEHTLLDARAAGDGFILVYLADTRPRIIRVSLDGSSAQQLDVARGAVVGLNAKRGDPEGFVGLSSVTSPTQSYLIETSSAATTSLPGLVQPADDAFAAPPVVVERRTAISKDGTPVPYFLIAPADADRSRPQPTLLYGYGGFKIPVLADYRPGWPCWLAAGGLLAMANLRGGGRSSGLPGMKPVRAAAAEDDVVRGAGPGAGEQRDHHLGESSAGRSRRGPPSVCRGPSSRWRGVARRGAGRRR
jgi:prolyl oligopeptidase